MTIWPFNPRESQSGFLGPKYERITRITLAHAPLVRITQEVSETGTDARSFVAPYFGSIEPDTTPTTSDDIPYIPKTPEDIVAILEGLPAGFTKDYDYGLGFAIQYRFIIKAVEALSQCTEIVLSRHIGTGIGNDQDAFFISFDDFDTARKLVNSTSKLAQAAARSVNRAQVHNLLAGLVGAPEVLVSSGLHPMRKLFTKAAQDQEALTDEERDALMEAMSRQADAIAESAPARLSKLRSDIELITLDKLVEEFKTKIQMRWPERHWQTFLNENPFVMEMVFGYPVGIVSRQAYVGGRKLDGSGEKITDYLVKNSLTDNVALIDIKTPHTRLMNKTPYRQEVFVPSRHVTGAISQVLDQKWRLERHFDSRKIESQMYDIQSFHIHCCLIVGLLPEDGEEKKSFEMFRGNSKDVQIITFDELLEKIENLRRFLAEGAKGFRKTYREQDLPF